MLERRCASARVRVSEGCCRGERRGTETAYDPELMMPFGAKCAVAIRKIDREGGQTLSQVAGWSGIFVGYGFSTGHGGSYRVYDPVRDMIMTKSINLCTVDQTTFPWRVRKEW